MIVRIQERDIDILRLINSFGFLTTRTLSSWYDVHYSTMQKRIKKLADNGFLKVQQLLWLGEKLYTLSKKGCQLTQDELRPLKKINMGSLMHDLRFMSLAAELKNKHKFKELVPERRLKHLNTMTETFNRQHMSDAWVITKDDKKIALELELTVKSKSRIRKIVGDFLSDFEIDEVWYYTNSNQVKNALLKTTQEHKEFIKIFELDNG